MWSARRTAFVVGAVQPLPYDMWICERGHVYITKPGLVLSCQRDGCDAWPPSQPTVEQAEVYEQWLEARPFAATREPVFA